MRNVISEQPAVIEVASSGVAAGITWSEGREIDFGAFLIGAESDIKNIRVRFPLGINELDALDGVYRPRYFLQNMPAGTVINSELSAAPQFPDNVALTTPVAGVRTYPELTNIALPTYWDATDKSIQTLKLQIAAGGAYNTAYSDKADPMVVFEWERQSEGQLGAGSPNPNSDHLFEFTDVNMYVEDVLEGVLSRSEVGWFSEEAFSADLGQDDVEFKKGKPKATVVSFMSEVKAMVSCETVTFDPWLVEQIYRMGAVTANNKLKFTEKNKQRPIQTWNIVFEWTLSSGHLVQLRMFKAHLVATGPKAPGGGDISKCQFNVVGRVTQKNDVYELSVSKSPIQRVSCPLVFAQTLV